MESLADIYLKLAASGIQTDKGSVHSYLPVYEELLAPYRRAGCKMLEIGLFAGHSMRMWESYFHAGHVYGIDLCDQPLGMADLRPMIAEGTHNIFLMSALDRAPVDRHFAGIQFDVIIEDSSHDMGEQVGIYQNFRDKLAPGGIYIIEDVQDIDRSRDIFSQLAPDKRVEIVDRRHVKGRYDDVLVVIRDR